MSTSQAPQQSKWHLDWQNTGHVRLFDTRSQLSNRVLVGHYRAFHETRLLDKFLSQHPKASVAEVGCATGEFYRYLKLMHPEVRYTGMDLSRVAIDRAKQKYPSGSFFVSPLEATLKESFENAGLSDGADVLYCKDVIHHQTDPFGFFGQLLELGRQAIVVRLRTRDVGATVMDPELSCQYHYDGWMPYLIFNLEEALAFVKAKLPRAQLVVERNHMILGGKENRFLPKECYLPQTGTAETALMILLNSDWPGQVQISDRQEDFKPHSFLSRLLNKLHA